MEMLMILLRCQLQLQQFTNLRYSTIFRITILTFEVKRKYCGKLLTYLVNIQYFCYLLLVITITLNNFISLTRDQGLQSCYGVYRGYSRINSDFSSWTEIRLTWYASSCCGVKMVCLFPISPWHEAQCSKNSLQVSVCSTMDMRADISAMKCLR